MCVSASPLHSLGPDKLINQHSASDTDSLQLLYMMTNLTIKLVDISQNPIETIKGVIVMPVFFTLPSLVGELPEFGRYLCDGRVPPLIGQRLLSSQRSLA